MNKGFLENLRNVLGISAQYFAERSCISLDQLLAIEAGKSPPTVSVIKSYSEIINIGNSFLYVLLVETRDHSPAFNAARSMALKTLNGYLKFCLWMMAFDETEKKVSR